MEPLGEVEVVKHHDQNICQIATWGHLIRCQSIETNHHHRPAGEPSMPDIWAVE